MKSILSIRSSLQTLGSWTGAALHPFLTLPSTETPHSSPLRCGKVCRSLKAAWFQHFLVWFHFSFDLLFYLLVWGLPHPLSEINYCNYPTFNSCWCGICRKYPRKCITVFICIFEKLWRWIGTSPQLLIDLNRRKGPCQMDFLFAYLICGLDITEQANIWMPGSATSVGMRGSRTALCTSALSLHCLSLEWVSAQHSHQADCQDT